MKKWYKKCFVYAIICCMLVTLSGNKEVCAMEQITAGSVDVQSLMDKGSNGAIAYLKENYTEDYTYGYEWIIFTLLRAGEDVSQVQLNVYYHSVLQEIKTWKQNQKPTDVARVAITLAAMGKDITDVEGVNLATLLYNNPRLEQGSNELTYALLALDAEKTIIPQNASWTREKMIASLLGFQNADGGFALAKSGNSGIDTTAMALQALAPYEDKNSEVKEAIEKAMIYLQGQQDSDYGYGTAEATAQVLIALAILEKSATDETIGFGNEKVNVITNLQQYYVEKSSGFAHELGKTKADSMATMQVLQAYTAYSRFLSGEASYWDFSDVTEDLVKKPSVTLNIKKGKLQVKKSTTALKVAKKLPGDTVVKWTSSNKKVATVSAKGKITAKATGTANITVHMKSGATAVCKVTVQRKKVTSKIRLQKTSYTLKVKGSAPLKYTLSNAFDSVKSFKSANKKIVTVSKSGVLTAKKAGKTKVTIQTKNGAKKTVKVTVKKK